MRYEHILLKDDFSGLESGYFSVPFGPHTEYHYLQEAGTKGNWVVSCFGTGRSFPGFGFAWKVKKEGNDNIMCQTYTNEGSRTHPMIIAGDSLWQNYKVTVKFKPERNLQSSGLAFRYRNDRSFYFFGVKNSKVYISKFTGQSNDLDLNEIVLVEESFQFTPGQYLKAEVVVNGASIETKLNDNITLNVTDDTYAKGKIGLVSNAKACYKSVEVKTTKTDKVSFEMEKHNYEQIVMELKAKNPKMKLWKKISTKGFGVARNLRFGDLTGNGHKDILIGQIGSYALNSVMVMTFDGEILWQTGRIDPYNAHLTYDVGFQIHDIDNDGKTEAIYCMDFEIIVADGKTGEIKYRAPTPIIENDHPRSLVDNDHFPKVLGDCLFFFDAEGKGYDSNILIKDRYWNFWVMNSNLEILWKGSCNTGHFPYAYDIDNDGKDELAIGYALYDDDGTQLWDLDGQIADHQDGVAIVDFDENPRTEPVIMYAASDAGYVRLDFKGNILKQYFIGHVQNPAVANFRSDKPGLETVTINFWNNQGIIHLFDSDGNIYKDFEPYQFGSMCLPLNWTGEEEEYFVLNPNIHEGGVFDGWGRKVLDFPDDGHPDMANAVLDLTGDCRDEIVVWDPDEIWIYTQEDNPKNGRLYKPKRNPLYNYSNYQLTVSLPGWNDD